MDFTISVQTKKKTDILVVGSGPAGVSSAIMAARCGMKVLLVEAQGRAGGISTAGMMSHFTGTVGNKLYHEILARAAEKNTFHKGEITTRIDPEYLTLTYFEMLEEAGADVLLYNTFCDVMMEGKKITGALFHNKDGFLVVEAKVEFFRAAFKVFNVKVGCFTDFFRRAEVVTVHGACEVKVIDVQGRWRRR